jgi:malate dehydrogenase
MAEVAIVGAGELGGSLAYVLARLDVVSSIRLIDESGRAAEGKALDIMQSAPIHSFATRMTGSTQLVPAASASIICVADRFGDGEWGDDDGLMLLKRIRQLGTAPVVICAGASQRSLVERGVRELDFPRTRLVGSAPEALASALKSIVAVEISGAAQDVALAVMGVPPAQVVVPWEESSIAGFAATRVLDEPTRRRVIARIAPLWPPGPHALASAAAAAVEAALGRARRTMSLFVAPDDTNGRRARAAALPVRLSARGIDRIVLPQLSARERVALENAVEL